MNLALGDGSNRWSEMMLVSLLHHWVEDRGKGGGRKMDGWKHFLLSSKHLPLLSHLQRSVVISVAGGVNVTGQDEIGGGMMLQLSLHHWEAENGYAGKWCQWKEGSSVEDAWCDVAHHMAVNVQWSEWQWTVCECNSPEGGHSWKSLAWHEWILAEGK